MAALHATNHTARKSGSERATGATLAANRPLMDASANNSNSIVIRVRTGEALHAAAAHQQRQHQ